VAARLSGSLVDAQAVSPFRRRRQSCKEP